MVLRVGRAWWRGIAIAVAILLSAALGAPATVARSVIVGSQGEPAWSQETIDHVIREYDVDETHAMQLLAVARGERIDVSGAWQLEQQDVAQEPLAAFVTGDHNDQFGGLWATREDAPVLHYHVGYLASAPVDDARALVPDGLDVEFHQVSYSRQELVAVVLDLADRQREAQAVAGEDFERFFNDASPDYANNVVRIEASDVNRATDFASQYGRFVTVVQGDPAVQAAGCANTSDFWGGSREDCKPVRGGIAIHREDPDNNQSCTITLTARDDDTGDSSVVSAAHCDFYGNGELDASWYFNHDATQYCFGPKEWSDEWQQGGVGDGEGQRFCHYDISATCCRNLIFTDNTHSFAVEHTPSSPVGTDGSTARCVSGIGQHNSPPSGYECGYLVNDIHAFVDGVHTLTGGQCDCDGAGSGGDYRGVEGGDSGAPVFATVGGTKWLFGGAETLDGDYDFADYSASDLGYSWCTNNSCSTREH